MPKSRKQLISLDATPYYHCTARCVRRAFLCGEDSLTGKSFTHRRKWIEDRLLLLGQVFCIDICAYAVMSNHLHVVLHVNEKAAHSLSSQAVCQRWQHIYKGTPLTQRFARGDKLSEAEQEAVDSKISQWRENLYSISWFMRSLCEPIARWANAEDECTGRFWEGRFQSQALLDEPALMACMAYVDLNPIRAAQADSIENSHFTSIQKRLNNLCKYQAQPLEIARFRDTSHTSDAFQLPFYWQDYYALVNWTGRAVRDDKRGALDASSARLLQEQAITPTDWLQVSRQLTTHFKSLIGTESSIRQQASLLGYQKPPGTTSARRLFH